MTNPEPELPPTEGIAPVVPMPPLVGDVERPSLHVRLFGTHEFFRLWIAQVVSSPVDSSRLPLPPAAVGLAANVSFTNPTLLGCGHRPKAGPQVFAHGAPPPRTAPHVVCCGRIPPL